jgi:hypothetical protein
MKIMHLPSRTYLLPGPGPGGEKPIPGANLNQFHQFWKRQTTGIPGAPAAAAGIGLFVLSGFAIFGPGVEG